MMFQAKIRTIVDKATDPWGIKVESVDLKHIELPQEMIRVMAKAAEADREKKAVIIRAEGELRSGKEHGTCSKYLRKRRRRIAFKNIANTYQN
jgi:regulator of protease activity HflC (stomatin/prohibitin superfamily)